MSSEKKLISLVLSRLVAIHFKFSTLITCAPFETDSSLIRACELGDDYRSTTSVTSIFNLQALANRGTLNASSDSFKKFISHLSWY
jgi:hypothetical protein